MSITTPTAGELAMQRLALIVIIGVLALIAATIVGVLIVLA